MSLRRHEFTKKDVEVLREVAHLEGYYKEFTDLLVKYSIKRAEWKFLTSKIVSLPLHNSLSVTYLTYLVVNNYEDNELEMDYLSELIVEIEDFVESLEELVRKYLK